VRGERREAGREGSLDGISDGQEGWVCVGTDTELTQDLSNGSNRLRSLDRQRRQLSLKARILRTEGGT
jgi:hypothetical protein